MPTEVKPVRIGMLSFAHFQAERYAAIIGQIPGAELAGIADDNAERGQEMAAKFGVEFCPSSEDLLGRDIDAVIICSENLYHRDLAVAAADAGKHILCQMPLSTSSADAEEIVKHCVKRKVKLHAALPSRFSPAVIQAKQAIGDGKIGKVLALNGTNRAVCPVGWFTDTSLSGGGAVIDRAALSIDLMRWLLGSDVAEVFAEISNSLMHKGFDDAAALTLTFRNGVSATVDPRWCNPRSIPAPIENTMNVLGAEGAIKIDLTAQKVDLYLGKEPVVTWESSADDLDLALIKCLLASVSGSEPVEASGEDGLAATAAALAAYESAQRGAPVKLNEQ